MVGTIDERKQEIKDQVKAFVSKYGSNQITIPVYDFIILLESLDQVCSEYTGAKEVDEIYSPISDKYSTMKLFEEQVKLF